MTDRAFKPPFAVPPGETIKELMESQHISEVTLGNVLIMYSYEIPAFLKGEISISPKMARGLSYLFNVPAQFWLGLQEQYDETQARIAKKGKGGKKK